MSLISRLSGSDETLKKIAAHQFLSAFCEWKEGNLTRAQVISLFSIVTADEADLDTFYDRFNTDVITRENIECVLSLGEFQMLPVETDAKMSTRLLGT